MNDKLLVNNTNEQEYLMSEIKKMSYIKYGNLILSMIRFILMFILISLFSYFPASITPIYFS